MASRSVPYWPIISAVLGVLIVIVALPQQYKEGWAPAFLNPSFHLGLDLAGGTQLDFRISEAEIQDQLRTLDEEIRTLEESGIGGDRINELRNEKQIVQEQQQNLVEAIRTVLERRINSLGVSEATITPSYFGSEKHLLVECPGVVDVQKCIDTVGKTIQLEFKEEFTEATEEYEASVRAKADIALRRITGSGESLTVVGEDLGDDLGVAYNPGQWIFRDQLPAGLESMWNAQPRSGVRKLDGTITITQRNDQNQLEEVDIPGVFLAEILSPRTQTGRTINDAPTAFEEITKTQSNVTNRTETEIALAEPLSARVIGVLRAMQPGDLRVAAMEDGSAQLLFLRQFVPGREEVEVSHILVMYKGANGADEAITRTKEEALAKAQDLKRQLDGGANFENIARTNSDGPSAANAGSLGAIARGQLVPAFENVAFTQQAGMISDPVETPFGYHIIRVDKAPVITPDQVTFDALTFTGEDTEVRANAQLALMQAGQITKQEDAIELRSLFFSLQPTGWKDTALDGKHFRNASVTLDPTTNIPVVQIVFDDEGGKIFQELTGRNIGKRIAIFVGGELVSAPTVQNEISGGTAVITGSQNIEEARTLAQDLNTGAIPAPIYLSGQRTVEATLGADALQSSVLAGLLGILVVMLFMIFMYRFLGVIASIALVIYAIIFLALLKLPLFLFTDQYIVLTLAGAAGMILSIGMAVDTNVLVFERVKEELKKGKSLKTAVEIGFEKAWPSIRDSNISTIITCILLFMIGTSIVRGFAATLGLGVVISMFTGMIIARWISRKIAATKLAEVTSLFPGMKKAE